MDHEGRRLRIFQPDRKESAHLGKMTKGRTNQKVDLKRWNLEVLEKEGSKVSPLGPPRIGKSAKDF